MGPGADVSSKGLISGGTDVQDISARYGAEEGGSVSGHSFALRT